MNKMRSAIDEMQDELEEEQKNFSSLETKFKEEQQKSRELGTLVLTHFFKICLNVSFRLHILAKRNSGIMEEVDELRKKLASEMEKNQELAVVANQKCRENVKAQLEMTALKSQFEAINAQARNLEEEKAQLCKRV